MFVASFFDALFNDDCPQTKTPRISVKLQVLFNKFSEYHCDCDGFGFWIPIEGTLNLDDFLPAMRIPVFVDVPPINHQV